jgi:O-antigen ligase
MTQKENMIYLVILTFLLAPTYVIRFSFLHLPANLLMVWVFLFWIIFGGWLIINNRVRDFIKFKLSINKKVLIPVCLFLLAGIISTFVGGIDRAKLGQFIVLFLQPISLFFISSYIISAGGGSASGGKEFPEAKNFLLSTFYFLLAAAGLYAIIQYFTLHGLPPAWWGNSLEPKRALSFFAHPNFYALWCTPLLALLLPDVFLNLKSKILNLKSFAWLIGALGLLLSLSRSGWLGLAAAIAVYLIVAADKKTKKIILAGAIIAAAIVVYYPNLRYRILLPFYGEKSASSRLELWGDGLKAVKKSPILGLGLTGFAAQYGALNTDQSLDTHNFPHNIFLNLWVETGAIGLISFIWLISIYIYRGLHSIPLLAKEGSGEVNKFERIIPLAISIFLIALLFQGLIDNPYFKNDLALVFWIALSLTM